MAGSSPLTTVAEGEESTHFGRTTQSPTFSCPHYSDSSSSEDGSTASTIRGSVNEYPELPLPRIYTLQRTTCPPPGVADTAHATAVPPTSLMKHTKGIHRKKFCSAIDCGSRHGIEKEYLSFDEATQQVISSFWVLCDGHWDLSLAGASFHCDGPVQPSGSGGHGDNARSSGSGGSSRHHGRHSHRTHSSTSVHSGHHSSSSRRSGHSAQDSYAWVEIGPICEYAGCNIPGEYWNAPPNPGSSQAGTLTLNLCRNHAGHVVSGIIAPMKQSLRSLWRLNPEEFWLNKCQGLSKTASCPRRKYPYPNEHLCPRCSAYTLTPTRCRDQEGGRRCPKTAASPMSGLCEDDEGDWEEELAKCLICEGVPQPSFTFRVSHESNGQCEECLKKNLSDIDPGFPEVLKRGEATQAWYEVLEHSRNNQHAQSDG